MRVERTMVKDGLTLHFLDNDLQFLDNVSVWFVLWDNSGSFWPHNIGPRPCAASQRFSPRKASSL
jgi:hypothetical protein